MSAAAYISAVMADSPRAFWKLQETSGLPQDSSGNGLHMTSTTGSPTYSQTGPMGDLAILLNAGPNRFSRSPTSTVTDNFTCELWFKIASHTGAATIYRDDNNGGVGWGLQIDATAHITGYYNSLTTSAGATALTTGNWYHIVVLRRSGTWEIYVNGSVDNGSAGTGAPGSPGAGVVQLGDGTALAFHAAYMAVYESALSSGRIAAHYSSALGQTLLPDADNATGGWTTAPLFSKLNDASDASIITATAS